MTTWTVCPDLSCGLPAEVVDRYWCEGSPTGTWMVATHCPKNHRYCTNETPTTSTH